MDDSEYYAMMRRQYSHSAGGFAAKVPVKRKNSSATLKTPGSFSQWEKKYGHEDAEMFEERNAENDSIEHKQDL